MEFKLDYIKDNESRNDISEFLNVSNIQNYNPIYNLFFKLNEANFNNIQLNEQFKINRIKKRTEHNIFTCDLHNTKDNTISTKDMFVKFAPIIDPTKYLIGKYDISNKKLFSLPTLEPTITSDILDNKKKNMFNSAYTDGFFSFLSSKLLHNHSVLNANDFYGSFVGNQLDFRCNVYDDIDYLCDSDFFHKHKEHLFTVDDAFYDDIDSGDSRNNKKKLKINNKNVSLSSIHAFTDDIYDNIFETTGENTSSLSEPNIICIDSIDITDECINLLHGGNRSKTNSSHSSCSSRTSITDNNNNDNELDSLDSDEESGEDSGGSSNESDINENIFAHISNFPVNIIALEKCHDTLDSYIMSEDITDQEWSAILLQVIFTLLIYQKTFQFTHNDLHTNNIMYNETDKQFIYYNFKNKYYKVPTFGKIWKIIDFGRAIYKFKSQTIYSDCFEKGEDADGQYNCEPFLNNTKTIIEPNMSFDLCRLGCSLFDFFIEDVENFKRSKLTPIQKIAVDWCYDDNNKNILYKKNGDERYPEFKLYKMIARTVHKHTPENQLEHDVFSNFQISRKKLNASHMKKVLHIDALPNYA